MYKKILVKIILLVFLFIMYSYILVIHYIPDEITIFEGENISLKTIFGITVNSEDEVLEVSANSGEKTINKIGNETLSVSLFDKLFLKNVDVSVLPKTTVIPVGNIAGVKLYTNGVLVVGMSEIEGEDSKTYKPLEFDKIKNETLEAGFWNQNQYKIDKLVIEMIASYGMAVGKEVFDTCVWIGRFIELASLQAIEVEYIYRKDEKMNLVI